MKYAIDETELARLEELAGKASTLPFEDIAASGFGYDEMTECSTVCNAVPALVAEVRRLREELNVYIEEDQSRVLLVQRQMLDFLREKVEAWEWCNQVQHIYDNIAFVLGLRQCAIHELYTTLIAAREAVHADSE